MGSRAAGAPRVVLSFNDTRTASARSLAGSLRAAGIDVVYDPWHGGGETPAAEVDAVDLAGASAVVVLLTRTGAAPTWVGEAWRRAVQVEATRRGVAILPVRLDDGSVPEFLEAFSYADLFARDEHRELRRLIATITGDSGDGADPGVGLAAEGIPEAVEPSPPPLLVELDPALGSAIDHDAWALVCDGLFFELGIAVPPLTIATTPIDGGSARVSIFGVPEPPLQLPPGWSMVNETAARLGQGGFTARPTANPANGLPTAWIPAAQAEAAEVGGLTTWDTTGYLMLALSSLMRARGATFITVPTVSRMLSMIEPVFPRLVEATVPGTLSVLDLTDVLRRLVDEEISVRNLRTILMTLVEWGRVETDPAMLTEYVRCALKRQISHKFSRGTSRLVVYLLDPELEETIGSHLEHRSTMEVYLDLPADIAGRAITQVGAALDRLPPGAQLPVILTTLELRPMVRRLLAPSFPRLHVVSYQELTPTLDIHAIGRIGLDVSSLRDVSVDETIVVNDPATEDPLR